jgi:hypothetical protein
MTIVCVQYGSSDLSFNSLTLFIIVSTCQNLFLTSVTDLKMNYPGYHCKNPIILISINLYVFYFLFVFIIYTVISLQCIITYKAKMSGSTLSDFSFYFAI